MIICSSDFVTSRGRSSFFLRGFIEMIGHRRLRGQCDLTPYE